MRIHITGTPGSNVYKTAVSLSSRLGLDMASAKVLIQNCSDNKYQTSRHSDTELNKQIDSTLKKFWEDNEDCIVDALCINPMDYPDDIHILLLSDITSEQVFPKTILNEKIEERSYMFDTYRIQDVFNPKQYDIAINVTGLSEDQVAQCVIDCIVKHSYGIFVPAHLVVPSQDFNIVDIYSIDAKVFDDVVFRIGKHFGVYTLYDDFETAQIYNSKGLLLKCTLPEITPTSNLSLAVADKWGQCLGYDNGIQQFNIMFARYCEAYDMYDFEKTYVQLSLNGNPVRKLLEMGYGYV